MKIHLSRLAVGVTLLAAAPALAEDKARLTYDAAALYAEYTKADPMAIMDKYMGKAVDLTGEVSHAGKAGDHYVVQLKTGAGKGVIQFDLKDAVKKGKKIKVACDGIGGWDQDHLMMMTDCKLAK